jgi:repressor LexA
MNRTEQRDLQGHAFIRNSIVHSGVTPSLREIAKAVGFNSPRSVQLMLIRLEKRGFIKRVNGVIQLSPRKTPTITEETVAVPLVGSVACGLPSLAEQDPEALIEVSTKIARPGHRYFFLRAKGTSMNRADINDGDFVLVRQQPSAAQGERVVALINDEATVKRFYREGQLVILRPDSTDKIHKPIVLLEDLSIQGVVVSTLPALFY